VIKKLFMQGEALLDQDFRSTGLDEDEGLEVEPDPGDGT